MERHIIIAIPFCFNIEYIFQLTGRTSFMTGSIWGIHMKEMCREPVLDGFIGIGWKRIKDLSGLPDDRKEIRKLIQTKYPGYSSHTAGSDAGVLHRFLHEVSVGDIVVYPDVSKPDRMVHIGRITGGYQYSRDGDPYPSRRKVDWIAHIPRNHFSASARSSISARKTFFKIKNDTEFRAALDGR